MARLQMCLVALQINCHLQPIGMIVIKLLYFSLINRLTMHIHVYGTNMRYTIVTKCSILTTAIVKKSELPIVLATIMLSTAAVQRQGSWMLYCPPLLQQRSCSAG